MLEVQALAYKKNGKVLIERIEANFLPGRLYGLLGPNGSGKSTFLKTLCGIWPKTEGNILWKGHSLIERPRVEISKTVAYVPQTPSLHFNFTIREIVKMGRYCLSQSSQQNDKTIDTILHQVNLWHLRDHYLSQVSGGERQRAYIARALASETPILLLDEPTSNLDLRHQIDIWTLLQTIVKQGTLVITAIHDFLMAKRYCQEILVLHKGHIAGQGPFDPIMTPSFIKEVFDLSPHEQTKLLF